MYLYLTLDCMYLGFFAFLVKLLIPYMGKDSLGWIFTVSVPSKFSQIYFRIALAISAHYLAQLKRGAYIHRKTFTVLLKPWKIWKFSPANLSPLTVLLLKLWCWNGVMYLLLLQDEGSTSTKWINSTYLKTEIATMGL